MVYLFLNGLLQVCPSKRVVSSVEIEKEKNTADTCSLILQLCRIVLFSMDDECCDIKCSEEASIRAHISSAFIH